MTKKSVCIVATEWYLTGSWSFDNDTARNIETFCVFCVDNSSSSHADNHKINFLVLGEGLTFGINGSLGSPEKKV